jgi:hypothetical protein
MKLNINAELTGTDILTHFCEELAKHQVTATPETCKVKVFSAKNNDWVELPADKLKIVFSNQ